MTSKTTNKFSPEVRAHAVCEDIILPKERSGLSKVRGHANIDVMIF
jgi:hypothetical protein